MAGGLFGERERKTAKKPKATKRIERKRGRVPLSFLRTFKRLVNGNAG